MGKKVKRGFVTVFAVAAIAGSSLTVYGAPVAMPDGTVFDADFYGASNPDVVAAYGTDAAALYQHYVEHGRAEGRKPMSDAEASLIIPTADRSSQKKTGGNVKDVINSAVLVPVWSGSKEVNDIIEHIFAQIITEEMTTYDKVKACYDWLIMNTEYGISDNWGVWMSGNMTFEDFMVYDVLTSHYGVCDHYSAAFAYMVRAIGLDCRVQGGLTHKADGGYTPHAWTVIVIDGATYVFDPQVEDNISRGGTIGYYRFGKTYGEVADKYIIE